MRINEKSFFILCGSIVDCFAWNRTKQGDNFWADVFNNLARLDKCIHPCNEYISDRNEFIRNNIFVPYEKHNEQKVENICFLLSISFRWSETPEGSKYWSNVYDSLKSLKYNCKDKKNNKEKLDNEKFQEILISKGWYEIASGYYSTVYGNDRYPKIVIKVNTRLDAWPHYVKWATDKGFSGTYAPKVFSLKYYDDFYVAVMERLDGTYYDLIDKIKDTHKSRNLDNLYNVIVDRLRRNKPDKYQCSYLRKLHFFNRNFIESILPGYNKFSREFSRAFKGKFDYDIHRRNWMFRGNDLVLIDPLSESTEKGVDVNLNVKISDKKSLRISKSSENFIKNERLFFYV